jgi:hypothetical protein
MKVNTVLALGCVLVASTVVYGQEDFHRNNITVGVGPAIPVSTNYLGAAPLFTVGYGYRFNRWFQADAGFQAAFGAANNQNAEQTAFGPVPGGDHEYMIPLGGRVYIPQPFKRLELSAGGGTAYLHYSETAPSGYTGYSVGCYTCTSRGGWGGYGLATVSYFLDDNHNFRVGTTFQFISASTSGQAVGNVPGISTTDHWANLSFEFGLSF